MKKYLKAIPCEIKDVNDEERSFLAVASTEDIDRDGDRIMAAGWDVDNFLKNPVIPWAHRYGDPPVAKAVEIGVTDGRLMFKPKFPSEGEYPFADTIWKLYKGGYLKAFSVGFMPKRWESVDRGKGMRGRDYLEQELWEISACTVPSNPNALVAAKSAGIISEEEEKSLANAERGTRNAEGGLEDPLNADQNRENQSSELRAPSSEFERRRLDALEQKLDAVLAALKERPAPVASPEPIHAGGDPPSALPAPSSEFNEPVSCSPEQVADVAKDVLMEAVPRRVGAGITAWLKYHMGIVD